MPFVKLFRT